MTMFSMSIYALASVPITVTSKTKGQILAARTLNCELSRETTVAMALLILVRCLSGNGIGCSAGFSSRDRPSPG